MTEIDIIQQIKDLGIAALALYFMYRVSEKALKHANSKEK